jgi:lipopolysaccharide export LptBFGC system permease protein LptF
VAFVSFLFGDQILPRTNHRLRSLMTDIYRTKPTFSLKEHVINEVQRGRVMLRTAQIDPATYLMRDVTLYNLEEAVRNRTIYADSGYLAFAPNQEAHLPANRVHPPADPRARGGQRVHAPRDR